jgi:hypothetical protein
VINLAASEVSTTEIDLSWTSNVSDAIGFEIKRSTDGQTFTALSPSPALDGSSTTYYDTGLTPDTHYWYQVIAIEPGGTFGVTAVDAYSLPPAPTDLVASVDNTGAVDLTWTNNSGAGTTFLIEIFDTGTNAYDVLDATDPGADSYSGLGAIDGANSQYQVLAESGDEGGGSASNVYTLSLPLAAPTDLVATSLGSGEVALTWANNSVTATGYLVYCSSGGGAFTNIGLASVDDGAYYDDNVNLLPGTTYSYYVTAVGPLGVSDPTDTVSAATDPTFTISSADTAKIGQTYELDATPYDPGGSNPITNYTIDWGDGNTGGGGGDPGQFTHTYSKVGDYVISATAETASGELDDIATQDVTVAVPQPTLSVSESYGPGNYEVQLTPTLDLDGATATSGYMVNWGDGSQGEYDAGSRWGMYVQAVGSADAANAAISITITDAAGKSISASTQQEACFAAGTLILRVCSANRSSCGCGG